MNRPTRFVAIVASTSICLLSTLYLTTTHGASLIGMFSPAAPHDATHDASLLLPPPAPAAQPHASANATFVMLARNSDVDGAVTSVRSVEDRFNARAGYPWVFLNEEPFSDEFKRRVGVLIRGPKTFGLVPREQWYQPESIDEERAAAARKKLSEANIVYGDSVSYRNMCRYNSGFFYRHELLQPYRYYWRVEPDVHFHCDINYDPFLFMQNENKTYGFTITMYEFEATIPTLWSTVRQFIAENPHYVARANALDFLSDDGGETYSRCHFWSNFEIADLDFWRGPAYSAFFDFLDATGGFYYERWGDAPVHSLAAALFAPASSLHFFGDLGYEHNPYTHCPADARAWADGRCGCDPARSFDYDGYSCLRRWQEGAGR